MRSRVPLLLLLLSLLCAGFLQITSGSRQLNVEQKEEQIAGQQGIDQAAGDQQAGDQHACDQQGGDQQTCGQQVGDQQVQQGSDQQGEGQQTDGQQGGGQQPSGQQSGDQQAGDQQGQQPQSRQDQEEEDGGKQVGICYGEFAGNQPPAQEAVSLVQSVGIRRMRLYGPDDSALQALRNTDIEVVLGVPNEYLHMLSTGQDGADEWVQNYIKNYQDVKFRYIVVGNGITPVHDQTSEFAEFLLPAMQNIQNAISASGLQDKMKVTTALDQSEILSHSNPPSKGEFKPEVGQFIEPIINFLVNNNNAPLLVNLHPYFSYVHAKEDIPGGLGEPTKWFVNPRLKYALFQQTESLVRDGSLGYTNVFDAMVDSVYSALEKANGSSLDVVVSETGWPTAGEASASIKIAATHNNNLINHVRNNGTPKRPHKSIETYIYNLFDENKKDPEVNKHWGVFWNNKQAKYQINFQGQ